MRFSLPLVRTLSLAGIWDAIRMAKDYLDIVKQALRLKKVGNELMILLGGREIHPINVRVGGFYSVPKKKDFAKICEQLKWARDAAYETVRWTARLPFPDFRQDYEFVSLRHAEEYPLIDGRLLFNIGVDIAVQNRFRSARGSFHASFNFNSDTSACAPPALRSRPGRGR